MNALITGTNCDIGISLSKTLLDLGYNLYLGYNNNSDNIDKLMSKYNNITKIHLDVTNEKEIIEVTNKIDNIDLLINLSAICLDNNYLDKTKEEFMSVLEVNLVGMFLVIKHLSKKINNNGLIINMSSTDGIDTYNELSIDYSASKAGIISMTKTFSLIFDNIKVISIAPNWVNTSSVREMNQEYLKNELKRIKQPRLIEVEELTDKIIELIKTNEIVSGEVYRIEGNYDRY